MDMGMAWAPNDIHATHIQYIHTCSYRFSSRSCTHAFVHLFTIMMSSPAVLFDLPFVLLPLLVVVSLPSVVSLLLLVLVVSVPVLVLVLVHISVFHRLDWIAVVHYDRWYDQVHDDTRRGWNIRTRPKICIVWNKREKRASHAKHHMVTSKWHHVPPPHIISAHWNTTSTRTCTWQSIQHIHTGIHTQPHTQHTWFTIFLTDAYNHGINWCSTCRTTGS